MKFLKALLLIHLLAPVVFSMVSVIFYEPKVFLEVNKSFTYELKLWELNGEDLEIKIDAPSCIKLEEDKIDLGWVSANNTISVLVRGKNLCEKPAKMKIKIEGNKEQILDALIIPFKLPRIKNIYPLYLTKGKINEITISFDYLGDRVCVYGEFVGENVVCSDGDAVKIKIYGKGEDTQILKILALFENEGEAKAMNYTLIFPLKPENKESILILQEEIQKEGKLQFSICDRCRLCLTPEEEVELNKNCELGPAPEFSYKILDPDMDTLKLGYKLEKEERGVWKEIDTGYFYLKIRKKANISYGYSFDWKRKKIKFIVFNKGDKKAESVHLLLNNQTYFIGEIYSKDYESIELDSGGKGKLYFFDGEEWKSIEVSLPEPKWQKEVEIWKYLIPVIIFAIGLVIGRIV